MKSQLALLAPSLALALGVSSISAAPISWTVHDITNDVTNISTDGTVVPDGARSGSTTDRTVNGVIFESIANSGNLFDSLFANDTINSRGWGSVVTNADYRNLLGQGQRSGRLGQVGGTLPRIEPTEVWTTVNFTGLTVGNSYQVQIWVSDNGGTTLNTALVLGDGVTADSPVFGTDAQLFQETTDGGVGQYATGVFVANATTQSFNVRTRTNLLTTPAWGNSDHFSNGWQIRDQGVDNSPPSPDAMTWASVPAPVNDSTITMTATTATDQTGVEYQFTRYAADGTTLLFTSPWQESPEYTDTGLSANTTYNYTVTARDKTPSQFTTAPSTPVAPATTPVVDNTPPSPSPLTWASVPTALGYSAITMTGDTATDDNGVEYQFKRYAADGTTLLFTSPWQDSPEYTDTGLSPNTTYNYTVTARDKSAGQNAGTASSVEPATTDTKGSATITWNTFDITNDVTNVSTAGSPVDARNGATSDRTVNGVTFLSVANSANLFDSLFQNDSIGARGYGNVVTDADYAGLLSLGQRSGRLGSNVLPQIEPSEVWTTVEFFGLTVGNTYQIQIWASDVVVAPDGLAQTKALVLGNGSASGPNELTDTFLYYEMTDGGAGQYGIGSFVANAPNQAFNVRTRQNLNTTPAWTNSDHFSNGWQIRDLGIVGPVDVGNSTVSASPASVPADGNTASTITVTVKDNVGNPVPGKVVSLTGNTGNAMIETANNMSNGAGIVTFTVKSNTGGTEQFTATVDSEAIPQTASVNFVPTLTLVINLGTSPAGTLIAGGSFIGTGPANLPIPVLPAESILRSIVVDAKLEATSSDNFASDLTLLLDTTAPTTGDNFSLAMISSGATANFNPSESLLWAGGAGGLGTSLTETKTSDQWTGEIDLATTSLYLGNGYTAADGTWSGTIILTYDDVSGGGPGYADWSGGEPFNEDKNGDGVENGLAFLLGALDPDVNARGLLPAAVRNGSGGLELTFNCRNAANRGSSTLNVQHSGDLGISDDWIGALVPDVAGPSGPVNGVLFDVTLGNPLNSVTATIQSTEAVNGKVFGRVSGSE